MIKTFPLRLTAEMHTRLKVLAANEETTMTELIIKVLESRLDMSREFTKELRFDTRPELGYDKIK